MKTRPSSPHAPCRVARLTILAFTLGLLLAESPPLRAADVTWNNLEGNFLWDLTDMNWSTGLWNNANGDGAIFGATGVGAITVASPINVNSIGFTADGYTLNGPGSINLVNGSSSLGTGYMFVDNGLTATINSAINTSVGLFKLGGGVLQLGGPVTFSGPGTTFVQTGALRVDVIASGISEESDPGGTLRVLNTGVFAPTTRVGINNGLIDFGANNQTLASVVFNNQSDAVPFNPAINAAGAGLIGTGTLRVTGDINVIGQSAGNDGANTIANNLDLGGGTQVIRTSQNGQSLLWGALQLTGTLSNGSLLTTVSLNGTNGFSIAADGLSLLGNNTYTGSTTINGGYNIASGTNASTSILISGNNGGPGGANNLTLFGANGSFLSANTIQVYSGGTLILDNTFADGSISGTPTIAAAQNNNRLSDTAELQMRDGNFTIRGLSTATASETIGKITLQGGYNVITLTPAGTGGTVTLTVGSDLTMSSRSTLQIASSTIGAASEMFVNGALPAADATGILPRIVGTSDFLTYNGTTGFTPYTGYAPDFTTAGTNVAVTAAASVPTSINVNAIKSTGTFATTITSGQTLGVTSGMFLNTSGTRTYTGGTIALSGTPGAFFGSNTVNSAITGSSGLLNAAGTLTLAGDLSGLTGTITQSSSGGITNLNTNTFAGAIEVREGTFNLNVSQTLAGQGAITLGVPANDAHLVSAISALSISGAGANAVIARDIIADNGGLDAAGQRLDSATLPTTISVLSNATGSQTLSGNITLNSPLRLQGGGASAASSGATIFSGNITGPGFMQIINGREVFSGNVSNTGGFYIGRQGNTAQVTFNGTTSGSVPLILSGGSNNRTSYTPGALPTGTITTDIVDSSSIPFLVPLGNSTINNVMNLSPVYNTLTGALIAGAGTIGADVGNGINATWAGPISGVGGLVKNGVGTLTLSGADTYAGSTTVGNGTLVLDYNANNTSYLGDGAALILGGTGGGTLNLSGGSHTEVVASTTLNAGANSVIQTGGSSTLQMNAITRNAGSTLNVGNGSTATTDTSNLGGNGILGGYATVGATTNSADWATSVNTGAADTAVTAFTTYDSFATSGTDNNNPLLTGSSALTGNLTTNSLKINSSAAGQSLDVVNTQTLTLNSGGLMFVGANDYQINNGTIKSGTATNSDLIVQQWGAGTLTINSVIANGTGTSTLTKAGTGTLALGAQNTYTGITYVNGGTLLANNATSSTGSGAVMVNTGGTLAGTGKVTGAVTVNGGTIGGSVNMGSTVTVNNGGTVGGSGSITGAATVNTGGTLGGTENIAGAVTVNYGGTISPGNGIGTLNTGNLTLSGTYLAEINLNNGGAASADLLNITGTVKINAGVLTLSLSNTAGFTGGTFLLVANDGTDAITGTLSSITGLPAGYSATVDYAYSGTDSLGRVGTDNDLAVTIAVPEPQSYVLLGLGAFALLFRGRRRI